MKKAKGSVLSCGFLRGARLCAAALALSSSLLFTAAGAAPAPACSIRIAVLEETLPSERIRFTEETAEYLRKTLPCRIELQTLDEAAHLRATETGTAEFFVRISSIYGAVKRQGARALAVMGSPASEKTQEGLAAAVVVRKGGPVKSIRDLRGRTVSATVPHDFGGEAPVLAEAALLGFSPEKFFGPQIWHGRAGAAEIIGDVLSGRADAGIVPSGYIEARERKTGRALPQGLAVLPQQDKDSLKELHSTHAYPGLLFWASRAAAEDDIRAVMAALLEMPVTARGEFWTVTPAFDTVNGMQKLAKIGPYAHLREWSLRRIWEEHALLVLALGLSAVFVILHGILAERLVKKRTAQVVREMEEREKREQELRLEREKIETLEKAGLIGQLSTMVAHELKQPLSAIISISRGLSRAADERAIEAETEGEENEALLSLCDEVEEQLAVVNREALKASEIIDAVRSYAKTSEELPERLDFEAEVRRIAAAFSRLGRTRCRISFAGSAGGAFVVARRLELELIVFNLMKNSYEACCGQPEAEVRVAFGEKLGFAGFTVEDSGPALSEEKLSSLRTFAAKSSKEGGMGVGMSLVRSLAESCGGSVAADRSRGGGLAVSVYFPNADVRLTEKKNEDQ